MLRALVPASRALPLSPGSFSAVARSYPALQCQRPAWAALSAPRRTYSSATPVLDYEAQLRGVIDKARRNVEAGVRAPTSEDNSLRLIMVAKPGGKVANCACGQS